MLIFLLIRRLVFKIPKLFKRTESLCDSLALSGILSHAAFLSPCFHFGMGEHRKKANLLISFMFVMVAHQVWNKIQNSYSDSHATSSIHCALGTVFSIQTCQFHYDFRTFVVFPPEGPEKLAQLSFPGVFDNCLVHMNRIVASLYLFSMPELLLLTTLGMNRHIHLWSSYFILQMAPYISLRSSILSIPYKSSVETEKFS